MEQLSSEDNTLDKLLEEQDICMLLQNCQRGSVPGTARLGIEAIEWKVKGLSGAEIAKMYRGGEAESCGCVDLQSCRTVKAKP